jgi:hypothetical protein
MKKWRVHFDGDDGRELAFVVIAATMDKALEEAWREYRGHDRANGEAPPSWTNPRLTLLEDFSDGDLGVGGDL